MAALSDGVHEQAVLAAEIKRIVRALRQLGVLHRDALGREVRAASWHEGTFERALAAAVSSGQVQRLAFEFYCVEDRG